MNTLQCKACNATIPAGARFCGRCGTYIDVDQVNTKPLLSGQGISSMFTGDYSTVQDDWNWQRVEQSAPEAFPPEISFLPLAGAGIAPSPGNVPVVQGTPQIGGVPSVQGTPQAPGSAMPHAPLHQAPAGLGGSPAAPNAPSAPVNAPLVSGQHLPEHHQPRRWFHRRHTEHHKQPSHHLHHSEHLHHSGSLHPTSQTLSKHARRAAKKSVKHVGKWPLNSVLITMVGIVVIGGLTWFLHPWQNGHAQPPAALILNGSVVPGGNISIQGRNFTPGGTITFTFDGQAASAVGNSSSAQSSPFDTSQVSLLQVVQQVAKAQPAQNGIIVASNGSFQTTIQVDPHWAVGSSHMLVATEQSSGQQARLTIVIPRPAQLTSCASATTMTNIVLGPITEGQAQPASTTIALCTSGSGMVQWTASWNKQQAKWLQVEQSGSIQAPLSKQLSISASASGLKAGSYDAIVTFTDQHGLKVSLNVMFIVRAAGATACLNTSKQSLAFSATLGFASPAAQSVMLTNCGSSGSWTATTRTDDGANWLSVTPTSGQLKAKASSTISISVASTTLPKGIYTGQVTMKTGTGMAVINVMLNVQPSPQSPSCMSVTPQSLMFSATQGQGNPGAQIVTVGNCGPAAAWSATASTSDGANWLSINPARGNLSTNTSANVLIAVSSAGLQSGTYTGQMVFKMGSSSQTVSVAFTVVQQQPKPCLSVNPPSLPFTATQGQGDPSPQTIMLTNCGPGGSWSASTVNSSSWLNISPTSNALNAGASQNVTVSPSISGLSAGNYHDTITFSLTTSSGTAQQAVQVMLTVQPPPPPPPCIHASPGALTFTGTQGQSDPAPQMITLSNCGSGGSWSASAANGSGWLGIKPTGSTLSAGAMQQASISVSLAGLSATTYTDTITFTITTSTGTAQASVAVTLAVQAPPPPCLQVSPGSLTFSATQGQGDPASQMVTLTNCGADGSWSASTTNSSSWLNFNPTRNSVSAGTSQGVTVSPSIAGLSANTYTDTIVFTLTNSGGTTRQSVTVTLTVQSPPPPPCLQITNTTPQASSGVVYIYPGNTVRVVVANCGSDTGTLSSVDGVSWLTDDLQQGITIAGGGSQTITITASSTAPIGNNGTVTITLTTSGGQAPVTVTVSILSPIQ